MAKFNLEKIVESSMYEAINYIYPEIGMSVKEAYQLQVPKKPFNMTNVTFNGSIRSQFQTGDCPNCKNHVDSDDDLKFCSECGQRLDWSN